MKKTETKSAVLLMHHLKALRLPTMHAECEKVAQQAAKDNVDHLGFLLRLCELELLDRERRAADRRLKAAKFPNYKTLEDFDFTAQPSLNKALIAELASCQWIKSHLNLLITGPTGVGKTWIACALAQKACREGYSVRYLRLPRLLQALPIAKGDSSYPKLLNQLAKTDVLLLDDWGLSKLIAEQRRDLLEILEDRHDTRSTIVTSQLPLDQWHHIIGDPTLADAILDRLVHNAYKLNLKGESMRKKKTKLTPPTASE